MSHLRRYTGAVVLLAVLVAGSTLAGCSDDNKLKVTGIDPKKGDRGGGQPVTIKGNGFSQRALSAKVFFGGRQGQVVRFNGDDELLVIAPGGELNKTVDVLIMFEPGGEKLLPNAFTFIEPASVDVGDLDVSNVKKK